MPLAVTVVRSLVMKEGGGGEVLMSFIKGTPKSWTVSRNLESAYEREEPCYD